MPSIQTQKKLEEIKSIINASGTCYDLNDLDLNDKGLLRFKVGSMASTMHGISITKNATIPYVKQLDCRLYIAAGCEAILPDLEHAEHSVIIEKNAMLSAPKLSTVAGTLGISNGNIEAPNLAKVSNLYIKQMGNKDFSSVKTIDVLSIIDSDNIKLASPLKLSVVIISNSNAELGDISVQPTWLYDGRFAIDDNSVVTVDTLSFNASLRIEDSTLIVNKINLIKDSKLFPAIILYCASLIVPSSYEKYLDGENTRKLDQDSEIIYLEE